MANQKAKTAARTFEQVSLDVTGPHPARKHVHSHQDGSLHEICSGSYDGDSGGHDGGEDI